MRPLGQRERRMVALGVLFVLVAIVVLGVIVPVIGGMAARALERSELRETYLRNQRVLAEIPLWRAQAVEQKSTAGQYAMVAPTEALAAEMLKQRLNRMTSEQGGTVQTVSEIQGDVPEGWVKVRADLQLTIAQLYKSLARLESEAPYVVVGYLSVAADRAAKTGHAAPMDVRIEVSAPVRTGQPS
ncbi:MAG: type II secretion system protein M [Alphaproteobacteria bacterium]|jgi:Tfp pilus assembly protein PilO|nr:type II secretion system protein M [Alphaproteobacteria bacterium]